MSFRYLFFSIMFVASAGFSVFADVIILNNSTSIQCTNIDMSDDWIYCEVKGKLKKYPTKDVFGVKIGNNDMQPISGAKTPAKNAKQEIVAAMAQPAGDNQSVIERYNQQVITRQDKLATDKKTRDGYIFWGITPTSIMSTNEVEMSIEIPHEFSYFRTKEKDRISDFQHFLHFPKWKFYITNKTDKPIYIDLANIFTVDEEKVGELWNNYKGLSEKDAPAGLQGMGSGMLTNVLEKGLASVKIYDPHWNQSTASRFLVIPPKEKCEIERFLTASSSGIEDNTYLDQSSFPNTKLHKWDTVEYTHDNAPFTKSFVFNYTTESDLNNYRVVRIDVYPRVIYGINNDNDVFTKELTVPPYFLWGTIHFRNQ